MPPPRVIYVAGWGRSGSTVLNRLLSGPDLVGVGELRWLWRRGVLEGQSCSCGQRWETCELWGPLLGRLGREQETDARTLARELDDLGRRSSSMLRQRMRLAGGSHRYVALLKRVYELIGEITGASVVLDTSKHPGHAVLTRATGLDVTIVHLVRDPRAVVWSHLRRKPAPQGVVARDMRTRPAPYVAARWTARNALVELGVKPDIRLRYEDMVSRTDEALVRVRRAIGSSPETGSGLNHVIAGNLDRFDRAPLQLRLDEEWKERQPRGQRLVTTAIALPLLHRYGYNSHG
ncbi:MAG TPA: sulfotransferase [Actinomycetota bacterium]|nr:sulfotransferase [Actinomycetota bacterium]